MKVEQWRRAEELFEQALERPKEERARFLDEECGGDRELRAEVASLLLHAPTVERPLGLYVLEAARALAGNAVTEQVGRRIGSYRLIKELGMGGMGVVYLAEHDDDDPFSHRVAIKLLSDEVFSPQAIARFRSERQILADLEHRNIVRLIGGGSSGGLPYLMMEYIAGTGIAQYAEMRELSVRARVKLVRQVCAALQYAHQRRVIHRDIKPSNILVDYQGVVKVLDFGIAKLLSPDGSFAGEAHTRPGFPVFTPGYASPEQARGDIVSTSTDVYSTGAVLYHLMTGRPPHQLSGTQIEILLGICEATPARPSAIAPTSRRRELAGDLDHIILKALHKDQAQRYASMEQLDEALGRWLDGLPAIDRRVSLAYRAGKLIARYRARLAAALTATFALALATTLAVRAVRNADERAQQAEAELSRAQRAAEREGLRALRARESEETALVENGQLRAEVALRKRAEKKALEQASAAKQEIAVALRDKEAAEQRAAAALANERRARSLAEAERHGREHAQAIYERASERMQQLESLERSRQLDAQSKTLTTFTAQ